MAIGEQDHGSGMKQARPDLYESHKGIQIGYVDHIVAENASLRSRLALADAVVEAANKFFNGYRVGYAEEKRPRA